VTAWTIIATVQGYATVVSEDHGLATTPNDERIRVRVQGSPGKYDGDYWVTDVPDEDTLKYYMGWDPGADVTGGTWEPTSNNWSRTHREERSDRTRYTR